MKVAYICDHEKDCNTSCGCCINGGPCMRTFDINHAKNFNETPIVEGDNRFIKEDSDEPIYTEKSIWDEVI